MKRVISTILCLAVLMTASCTADKTEGKAIDKVRRSADSLETEAEEEAEETTTETTVPSPAPTPTPEVKKHEFQTKVFTTFHKDNYGADSEAAFNAYCEALLNGDTEFDYPYETPIYLMYWFSRELMPLGDKYTTVTLTDTTAHIEYNIPHGDYMAKVEEFKKITTDILDKTCKEDYTDLEKALSIYEYLVHNCTYDYDMNAHQPYGVLTEGIGICQDIAPAYAFLLNQAGIEAISCGGQNDEAAHDWTVVWIDGRIYHCDATFGLEVPGSLRFFGMDDERRIQEGDWNRDLFNYSYNIFDPEGKYTATDDSFEPLQLSSECVIDYDNDEITYTSVLDGETKTFRY